ncbi:MAG: twin-arginine translocase TatA/TatE family subunit [Anaerolineae bacterium]|nr:twin-arginine translocase TatA/TatE family subunit [Anaerolineae bacterium]
MFKQIGPLELVIILTIVLLLFGVGRIGKVGRELGTAISEMRKGLKEGAEEPAEASETEESIESA